MGYQQAPTYTGYPYQQVVYATFPTAQFPNATYAHYQPQQTYAVAPGSPMQKHMTHSPQHSPAMTYMAVPSNVPTAIGPAFSPLRQHVKENIAMHHQMMSPYPAQQMMHAQTNVMWPGNPACVQ